MQSHYAVVYGVRLIVTEIARTIDPDVLVVGGGPAGLAAAYRLQQAGHRVRVLERTGRAGSKMSCLRRDGFLLDTGAIFLPSTYTRLLGLAREIGLGDDLVDGGFTFGLAADGEIHELDGADPIRGFLKWGALSARGKAQCVRLAPDAWRSRLATVDRIVDAGRFDSETLGSWAERTLPRELRERLISGAIRGIFAAEPDQVSRVEFLGILALFNRAKLLAFQDGMAQYADHLASLLDIVTGAEVLEVLQTPSGAEVTWRNARGEHTEGIRGCVVALPAQIAARIRSDLDPWRARYLNDVRRGKVITPNVALSRPPSGLDAAYTMIPRSEHATLGGIGCDHHKAPGRAPAGKGLLTLTFTTDWCEQHFDDDDETVGRLALDAVERLLPGTIDSTEFVQLTRWEQQYSPVGHYRQLGEYRWVTDRNDQTVQLAGEYLSAPNLNAATASGEAAAAVLARVLGTRTAIGRPARGETGTST
jgi:protoporphyrinogen/coproporphyrinogen III oxidase